MSLKSFHILFISLSTLLALGLGGWGVAGYVSGLGVSRLLLGVGSLLGAVVLIVYGVRVREKLKVFGDP